MEVPLWGEVSLTSLLLTLIVILAIYTSRDFGVFYKQGIPCLLPLPFIGNMYILFIYMFKTQLQGELEGIEYCKKKGCTGFFVGLNPWLMVQDEEMLSEILIKQFSAFPNSGVGMKTGTIFDNMLNLLEGQHWKNVRNEMTPALSSGKLKQMNGEINRCARLMVDCLEEAANQDATVEMKKFTGAFAMDAIAATAFGIKIESLKDENNPFILHVKTSSGENSLKNPMVMLRFMIPGLNTLCLKLGYPLTPELDGTERFLTNVINQLVDMRQSDPDQFRSRSDFLQLMIRSQKGEDIRDDDDKTKDAEGTFRGLTTEEMLANAMLFFLAGKDTTSNSLGYFMHNMAVNPECQATLTAEIDRVVGDKDVVDNSLTQEMPYLDQCIHETLRLFPLSVAIMRRAAKDATVKGINIKKGMTISIPVYAIQHDPKKWPEPFKFDPQRFSPENKKKSSPYHFLAFGDGPRHCIGMRLALLQMKVVIIHILRRFTISKSDKTKDPLEFKQFTPVLTPKDGFWVKLTPRIKN